MMTEAQIKSELDKVNDYNDMWKVALEAIQVRCRSEWDGNVLLKSSLYAGIKIGLQMALGITHLKHQKPTPRYKWMHK